MSRKEILRFKLEQISIFTSGQIHHMQWNLLLVPLQRATLGLKLEFVIDYAAITATDYSFGHLRLGGLLELFQHIINADKGY